MRFLTFLILLCSCTGVSDLPTATAPLALRIFLLGDSNTEGWDGDTSKLTGGYRLALWRSLRTAAPACQPVGTRHTGPAEAGSHDGTSGATTTSLLSMALEANASSVHADLALIMVGTNDVTLGVSADEIAVRVVLMAKRLASVGVEAHILAIPLDVGGGTKTVAVNKALAHAAKDAGVIFDDWTPSLSDLGKDGKHLSATGAARLGAFEASVVLSLLR